MPKNSPLLKGHFPRQTIEAIQKHLNELPINEKNLLLTAPKNAESFTNNHNLIVNAGGSLKHFKANKKFFIKHKNTFHVPLEDGVTIEMRHD